MGGAGGRGGATAPGRGCAASVRSVVASVLALALLVVGLVATEHVSDAAGEAIVAGELRLTPTLDHIGVVWFVEGDTDLDSTMTIEFRKANETTWKPGAPAMRAEPTVIVDGSALGINSWAASAMFLDRGQDYEIRATIVDPDGGNAIRLASATTRTLAEPSPTLRYVVPGSSGGSGTEADPYRGLQAAADSAQPGDTFVVAGGNYSPFSVSTSGTAGAPISFVGATRTGAAAIVDGAGTDRGVVTIESASHVIVAGLHIRNGRWGVDAQNTQNLVIADNTITDVDFGVYNRRDGDLERYQVVCNNDIVGRTAWPGVGIPGERGIDLRGWGNTVCDNRVSNFGDCVSVQAITGASFGNDVYGNDANRCVDDGIEVDYNQANVRVYANRVTNARMGVSVQPIYGGPAYVLRNELVNLESNTIKLNNGPSGLFIAHNTGVKLDNGLEDGSVFNNTVLRNNLFIGTRYAFEFTTETTAGSRDFDFGAWGSLRSVGEWFKWDNVRYARMADLPDGVEDNGIEVGPGAVVSLALPSSWDVEVQVAGNDLRPSAGSALIDAGIELPNINEGFVTDGAPDAGAFEAGSPPPTYGPGPPLITVGDAVGFVAGDADCSGAITIVDVLVIAQYLAAQRTIADSCPLDDPTAQLSADRSDINGDNQVDVADAREIIGCMVGFTRAFCPPG